MYYQAVRQYIKMLNNLSGLLDKAEEFSQMKKFDVSVLLNSRLAPDQYPLLKQVQIACDTAKGSAARLAGKVPPRHEDNEKTVEELKERIKTVVNYLSDYRPEDFKDAAERKIEMFIAPGNYLTGEEALLEFSLPNFYFHVTTAYAILRHNGMDLGKSDFMGGLPLKPLE